MAQHSRVAVHVEAVNMATGSGDQNFPCVGRSGVGQTTCGMI